MKTVKSTLGKGLAALIQNNAIDNYADVDSVNVFAQIAVEDIEPNPYQPRQEFDQKSLSELKDSILEKGIIQPITVCKIDKNKYRLISGERRLRAAKLAKLQMIPSYIIEIKNDSEMLELALIENIQRDTLNPIEIAFGYKRLIEECNLTQEDIAKKTGKDRTTITNFIRLLKLPDAIQTSLKKNEISTSHARALISIEDSEEQLKIWQQILENKYNVRKVETLVKQVKKSKKNKTNYTQNVDSILTEHIDKLQILFGTKINIKIKNDYSGDISIVFYSKDDLERILEILDEK